MWALTTMARYRQKKKQCRKRQQQALKSILEQHFAREWVAKPLSRRGPPHPTL
jgi:hypothetical protein